MIVHDWTFFFITIVSVFVYWCVLREERHRLLWLILTVFVAIGRLHPAFTLVASFLTLYAFLVARKLQSERCSHRGRQVLLLTGLALWFLFIAKYGKEVWERLLGNQPFAQISLLMPVGISYFTFKIIHYLFEAYRGKIEEVSLLKLASYLFSCRPFPPAPLKPTKDFSESVPLPLIETCFLLG